MTYEERAENFVEPLEVKTHEGEGKEVQADEERAVETLELVSVHEHNKHDYSHVQ